eukprot:42214-Pelagomonas_calceolata.AAC.3
MRHDTGTSTEACSNGASYVDHLLGLWCQPGVCMHVHCASKHVHCKCAQSMTSGHDAIQSPPPLPPTP